MGARGGRSAATVARACTRGGREPSSWRRVHKGGVKLAARARRKNLECPAAIRQCQCRTSSTGLARVGSCAQAATTCSLFVGLFSRGGVGNLPIRARPRWVTAETESGGRSACPVTTSGLRSPRRGALARMASGSNGTMCARALPGLRHVWAGLPQCGVVFECGSEMRPVPRRAPRPALGHARQWAAPAQLAVGSSSGRNARSRNVGRQVTRRWARRGSARARGRRPQGGPEAAVGWTRLCYGTGGYMYSDEGDAATAAGAGHRGKLRAADGCGIRLHDDHTAPDPVSKSEKARL